MTTNKTEETVVTIHLPSRTAISPARCQAHLCSSDGTKVLFHAEVPAHKIDSILLVNGKAFTINPNSITREHLQYCESNVFVMKPGHIKVSHA